jgi:hypothetical protein
VGFIEVSATSNGSDAGLLHVAKTFHEGVGPKIAGVVRGDCHHLESSPTKIQRDFRVNQIGYWRICPVSGACELHFTRGPSDVASPEVLERCLVLRVNRFLAHVKPVSNDYVACCRQCRLSVHGASNAYLMF